MTRYAGGRTVVSLISLLCLAQPVARAQTANTEERDFAILVDGKEAGQSRIAITVQKDGTTVVSAMAKVKFTQLIVNYSYQVDSTEWWKEGKLIGLKTNAVENGKRTEVTAASDGGQLKLKVNGKERLAVAEAWTSSFWKLADARYHNKSVRVLDSDSGKEYSADLKYIGTEQLTLLGQPQNCYHFRVSGGSYPIDAWFDRYHRLVRQEFTDTGHKTIVQLVGLKR